MRMNGSCAGGTGAFIDEMAKLMGSAPNRASSSSSQAGNDRPRGLGPLRRVRKDRYPAAAQRGHSYHRPGAFGASRGRPPNDRRSGPGIDIEPPVIFEGGTLAYNPTLVRVFREQLNLSDDQVIVPRDPQIMVARGAALSLTDMFASSQPIDLPDAFVRLDKLETVAPASGRDVLPSPFCHTCRAGGFYGTPWQRDAGKGSGYVCARRDGACGARYRFGEHDDQVRPGR